MGVKRTPCFSLTQSFEKSSTPRARDSPEGGSVLSFCFDSVGASSDAVYVRKRRRFLTENDAVSGVVVGVRNCVVIDAVYGIGCSLEDDLVFVRAPPATAVAPFE